jgi:hypothetical protein
MHSNMAMQKYSIFAHVLKFGYFKRQLLTGLSFVMSINAPPVTVAGRMKRYDILCTAHQGFSRMMRLNNQFDYQNS